MKKFKRIIVSALAIAMLMCMIVIPASAAKDSTASANDSGSGYGIHWSTSLNVSGKNGTARITVYKNTSGEIPAYIDASLEGAIESANELKRLVSSADTQQASSITVSRSESLNSEDVTYAYCAFVANGEPAGFLTWPEEN